MTARYVARLLSSALDGLVTVDPHLHRLAALDQIYSMPTRAVGAAPRIAAWVRANVARPALVGPDTESVQWVSAVAAELGCPSAILTKVRRGDRDVTISPLDEGAGAAAIDWSAHTPVLIDDIVSTARTMTETIARLRAAGAPPPVCVGVHAGLQPARPRRPRRGRRRPRRDLQYDPPSVQRDRRAGPDGGRDGALSLTPRMGTKSRLALPIRAARWVTIAPPGAVPLGCATGRRVRVLCRLA